jgi:uncharacterized protein YqgC (DUF456 family)
MAVFLLCLALAAGLLLIPFGLPGLWLMTGGVALYAWLGPPGAIGWWTVGIVAAVALAAEFGEFVLTARATRRSGGSTRGAWWALIGSIVGAALGVPVPVVGSVVGAFVGAFVGAWLAELSLGRGAGDATRAATGALTGRVLAVGLKLGAGVAIAALVIGKIVVHASM